ncbi:hypothetical protein GCM10023340_32180 [Nocardioides marinquilinus]|uniref:ABC transporter permease n=1 Tax=Nocardioides marinquilinus TaxID=1210400 RepID=A0ABP9PUH5_9ACTN
MTRLLLVELTRLRWRRAVVLLVLVAVVIPMVVLAVRAWDTRAVSDAERAEVRAQIERDFGVPDEVIAECLARPRQYFGPRAERFTPERLQRECSRTVGFRPTVSDYVGREPLTLRNELTTSGFGVVAVLVVAMLLAGTTFVGHDWSSGSMSNQLLFEPRRLRVWAAKAVAVGLLSALVATVVLTVYWGALGLIASARDVPQVDGITGEVVESVVWSVLLVTGAAVGGYALTMLSRSTVFTVGVLFGVSIVSGVLLAALPDGAVRWNPGTNAFAVVNDGAVYYVEPPPSCFVEQDFESDECRGEREVTRTQGGLYLGGVLLLAGAWSASSYRRRDVP